MITDPNWISAITSVAMLIISMTSAAAQILRMLKKSQRNKTNMRMDATTKETATNHSTKTRRQWFLRNGLSFAVMAVTSMVWLVAVGLDDAAMTRSAALLMAILVAWFVLSLLATLVYALAAIVAPPKWLDLEP